VADVVKRATTAIGIAVLALALLGWLLAAVARPIGTVSTISPFLKQPPCAPAGARCVQGSKMHASWSIPAAAIVIGTALPASADDLATRLSGRWLCYSSPSQKEYYGVNGVFIVVGEAGLPRAGRWSVSGSERTIVFRDGAHQTDQMTFTSEKEVHRVSKGGVLRDGSPYVEGLASDARLCR
jgi:hypothetical protein